MSINAADLGHLRRCVELAREALIAGNAPFGSLLVDAKGDVRFEDRNRTKDGDDTQHPEFAIARWAAANLAPVQRVRATVYTSGEHCPMCAAAHGWVGLGRIVYAASSEQLVAWQTEWRTPAAPVRPLPISAIAPRIPVDGPAPELTDEIKALYQARFAS